MDDFDNEINFDNDAVGSMMPPTNTFEDEHYRLQRDMLMDDTGIFLIQRLQQLPKITPRARTKVFQIITTFFSQKNAITNYGTQKEFDVASLNLDVAIEIFWLGLNAWDLADSSIPLMIDLIRSSYFPTILRGKNGFERIQQNTNIMRSQVENMNLVQKRKKKKFGLGR